MSQLTLLDPAPQVSPLPTRTDPWKVAGPVSLYHGDCIEVMARMPSNSVDALVTDGPYGLGFMGQAWDTFKPGEAESRITENRAIESDNPNLKGRTRGPASSPSAVEYDRGLEGQRAFQRWTEQWAREAFRVLKPGGHVLSCGAPRSAHRMTCGLEDAGFEVRDSIAWLFAQGFPKSMNLGKAIDRAAGAQREVIGHVGAADPKTVDRNALDYGGSTGKAKNGLKDGYELTKPATELAEQWSGWGTALKPGHEPIAVARKPLDGTVEENVRRWGIGALNIDRCRLEVTDTDYERNASGDRGHDDNRTRQHEAFKMTAGKSSDIGRWPANVALSEYASAILDAQAGDRKSGANPTRRTSEKFQKVFGKFKGAEVCDPARGAEVGGASRFFFVAKPSRLERDFGCDSLPMRTPGECTERTEGSAGITPYAGAGRSGGGRNSHPTVKPVSLMRWLIWLVTPEGGVVLDPFLGSGTTGMAAVVDGYTFIGIEREEQYLQLSDARISAVIAEVA